MSLNSQTMLYDTLSGGLKSVGLNKRVSLYVCGPTVYGLPHLGHGRFVVAFDILVRWLRVKGCQVKYVSNITDIDDKIIKRAEVEKTTVDEIAKRYEASWWESIKKLNVTVPDMVPHATDYVEAMLAFIDYLYSKGHAYEISDGLYLDVSRVENYGILSKQPLELLKAGARVELNPEKKTPFDFALWKFSKPGEPYWNSPWGKGRPGWHTECVVMSLDSLGDGFDIHGGAQDLIFPHHENEIAQASLWGKQFAKHWVHNGLAMIEGEKMSKSLGNFTNLEEVFNSHDPRAFRIACLKANYRSPVELSKQAIKDAQNALERLLMLVRRLQINNLKQYNNVEELLSNLSPEVKTSVLQFCEFMDDDLNTPAALAHIFNLVTQAHNLYDQGDVQRSQELTEVVCRLCSFLGLDLVEKIEVPDEILELLKKRELARKEKNWLEADQIRQEIATKGYSVEDTLEGPRLYKKLD